MHRFLLSLSTSAALLLFGAISAEAQATTYTTTLAPVAGGTATDAWSTQTWTGSGPTPLGSSTTTINITASNTGSAIATITLNNDSTGATNAPFQLNVLNISFANSFSSGSSVLTFGGAATHGFSFNGTNNQINFTPSGALGQTSIAFSLPVAVSGGLTITDTTTGTGAVTFTGGLTGSGGLVLNGSNIWALTSVSNTMTGGITLNGGSLESAASGTTGTLSSFGTLTLNGGALDVTNGSSGGTGNNIVINGDIQLGNGAGIQNSSPTYAGTVNLDGGTRVLTIDNSAGNVQTFNGVVSNGSIVVSGLSTLVLANAANNFSALTDIRGAVQFNNAGSFSASPVIITGGGALVFNTAGAYSTVTALLASGKLSNTSAGSIALAASSTENINFNTGGYNSLMLGAGAASVTYDGTITPGSNGYELGGAVKSTYILTITGTGGAVAANALTGSNKVTIGALGQPIALSGPDAGQTLGFASQGIIALNNSNDTSGATTVAAQTLNLTAAAANTFGDLHNSAITVNPGATLAIDSNNATTIPASVTRAASLSLDGATVTDAGSSVASSPSNDTITNALTLTGGLSTLTLTIGGTNNEEVSFGSYSRASGGGLLDVRGLNFAGGALAAASSSNVLFTGTTPTLDQSGTAGTSTQGIVVGMVGATNAGGGFTNSNLGAATNAGTGFLTYDGTTGLRPLTTSEYSFNPGSITANSNIWVTTATAVSAGSTSPTINSLILGVPATSQTDTTNNSTSVTGVNTTLLVVGQGVSGTGIPTSDTIASIGTNSITLSAAATNGVSETLTFAASASTFSYQGSGTTTVTSGMILSNGTANIGSTTAGTLAFAANEAIIDAASGTLTIKDIITGSGGLTYSGAGSLTLSGINTFYGNLVSEGTGTLTLSTANANLGATTILSGTVVDGNASALGTGSTTILLGDTSGSNAAALTLSGVTLGRSIQLQSGNNGTVTLSTGATAASFTGGTVTLGTTSGIGHNLAITGPSAAVTGIFTDAIVDPGSLVSGTGGIVTLTPGSNASAILDFGNTGNTYTGGTVINGGTSGSALTLGSGAGINGGIFGTGLLVINGAVTLNQTGGAATVTGTQNQVWNSDWTIGGTQAVNWNLSGAIDLGSVANGTNGNTVRTLTDNNSAGVIIAGALTTGSNTYTNSFTKAGTGALTLTGTNTYTGVTGVSGGTLNIGNGSTGSIAGSGATVAAGTFLDFNGAPGSSYNGTIADSGTVAGTESVGTNVNTLGGAISGTGVVNQTGIGTTILTGLNSYSGGTTISGGALLANTTNSTGNSATGTGAVAVNSGGTLGGSGLITPSGVTSSSTSTVAVNIAQGAVLSPSNGTAGNNGSFASHLTFALSSGTSVNVAAAATGTTVNLVFDLGTIGSSDEVLISGGGANELTLNGVQFGNFTFNQETGFGAGTYTLFQAADGGTADGIAAGALGATVTGTIGTYNATLQVNNVGGNDDLQLVVVASVPEPSTWALLLLGGLGLLVVEVKRRRGLALLGRP